MANDIVALLRDWKRAADGSGYGALLTIFDEAADEIERLRRQACQMSDERTEMLTEHGKIVETLTAERDEARRMVCSAYALRGRDIATERGWDCWKEDANAC